MKASTFAGASRKRCSVTPFLRGKTLFAIRFLSILVACCFCAATARAATLIVRSDASWRATSVLPASGWNSDSSFNDSDSAAWEFAFKSPSGNNIWIDSNLSTEAPDQAWFRRVFFLTGTVLSAQGLFFFDDDGEAYINGTIVVVNTPTSPNSETIALDPGLFRVGANVVAVHGIDTHTPFNNIAVNMTVTDVPEPAIGELFAATTLLFTRRRRK
jgi:hypothetical protein